ncbi:MAG: BBP7 family outer membrane beta-barrel protein [Rhodopirellula sp.]|nr:BBP7 family outer membrane beta-barrel protein [Rhodopirellula sp.]
MSLYRAKPWLGVWLSVLLTGAMANAQGIEDMQLFAPTEFDQFGGGPRADQGFFFQFDGLYWSILAPDYDPIGEPGLTREVFYTPDRSTVQHNTISNSNLAADAVGGQRFEFGNVCGHHGWMASIFYLHDQNQRLTYSDADIVFDDQPFQHQTGLHGRLHGYVANIFAALDDEIGSAAVYEDMVLRDLPVEFDEVILKNKVETWGTELNYIFRTHPAGHGGIFEFLFGVRYLKFNETFSFDGYGQRFDLWASEEQDDDEESEEITGVPYAPNSILADSSWWSVAENHIYGPQLGLRWFRQSCRWTLSSEARFFAGFNSQNLEQAGVLGTKLDDQFPTEEVSYVGQAPPSATDFPFQPITMEPIGYKHMRTEQEWSPGVELRFDLAYKLTRAVDVKVGWTGMWIDGIARASNLIDYSLTETSIMGIDIDDNRQSVFMHGLNIGFNINR